MITGNQICLHLPDAGTYYVQVPIACQIGTVRATCQNGSIAASTVTLKDSSGTYNIGVATFTTALGEAGGKAAYVADTTTPLTTYGNRNLAKNEIIQVILAVTSAGAGVFVQIDLDPYALS